jgi:hypothetical protein
MLYLTNVADLPIGIDYRVLGESLPYWDNLSLIEVKEAIEGLRIAPDIFPNGEPTTPTEDCVTVWEIKKAETLPDLEEAVRNVNINANNRPVETLQELLKQAPLDNAVNLYNCDGTIRVEKVID